MNLNNFFGKCVIAIFILSFSNTKINSQNFHIGGELYDFNSNKIDAISDNIFDIMDKNGIRVDYQSCANPSSHPNLTFNLCLLDFNQNRLPLSLKLKSVTHNVGRTVLDDILMQRSILGWFPFESFLEEYCADINKNESVSTLDNYYLRRSITGEKNWLNGPDFLMFPVNQKLDYSNVDFEVIKSIQINELPKYDVEFIPYHQGDLNGSVFSTKSDAELSVNVSDHDSLIIRIPNINIEANRHYLIGLYTDEIEMIGHQVGIRYNDLGAVTLVNYPFAPPPYLTIGPEEKIQNKIGIIAYLENAHAPEKVVGKYLEIEVLAYKNCRAIDFFNEGIPQIPNRIVMGDLSVRPIKFVVDYSLDVHQEINSSISMIASPNPSSNNIKIRITAPQGITNGQLVIFNNAGKTIIQKNINLSYETNEVNISSTELPKPGVYYGILRTIDGIQNIEIVKY